MALKEALNQIADEAWEGDVVKSVDMMNVPFTLIGAELVEFTDKDDEGVETTRHTYKATVQTDGDPYLCWLGGKLCLPQVAWMLDNNVLPAKVKLIRDADRKGSPYKLIAVDDGASKVKDAKTGKVTAPAGWPQENGRGPDNEKLAAMGLDAAYEAFKAAGLAEYLIVAEDGETPILIDGDIPLPSYAKIKRLLVSA